MNILITKRLTLRPPLDVDAENIFQALSNPEVAKNLSHLPCPYRLEDAETWVKKNRSCENGLVFTLHRNRLIGVVSIEKNQEEAYHLGYWLAQEAWGQGYMSEAVRAVLSHAFNTLACDEIYSGAYQDNPASHKILEKMGFAPSHKVEDFNTTRQNCVTCEKLILTRQEFEKRFGLGNSPIAA